MKMYSNFLKYYILGSDASEDNSSFNLLEGSSLKNIYKCLQCNYVAKRKDTYQRHLLVHSGERRHQCRYCLKLFTRKDNLKVHVHTYHGDEDDG